MTPHILTQTGTFSPVETALFDEAVICRTVAKGAFLLRQGQVCRSVYYILNGSVYQYSEGDGQHPVIDLHLAQEWCFNHASFVEQRPSITNLVAFAPSEVLELTVEQLHGLIARSPAFLQLGRILQQGVARLHYFDNDMTPTQKYEYVLERRPRLLQTFPLHMIASYLKITPETLSRVREKLTRRAHTS